MAQVCNEKTNKHATIGVDPSVLRSPIRSEILNENECEKNKRYMVTPQETQWLTKSADLVLTVPHLSSNASEAELPCSQSTLRKRSRCGRYA